MKGRSQAKSLNVLDFTLGTAIFQRLHTLQGLRMPFVPGFKSYLQHMIILKKVFGVNKWVLTARAV